MGTTPVEGVEGFSNVWATAPDDGGEPTAVDVRMAGQVGLNNTLWLQRRFTRAIEWFVNLGLPGQPLYVVVGGGGYVAIPGPEVTIPDCRAGDVFAIDVVAIGTYTGPELGALRIATEEDRLGSPITNVVPGGFLWWPGTSKLPGGSVHRQVSNSVRYQLQKAGEARVFLEGTADDTALTLTTLLQLRVQHYRQPQLAP